jgi:hypothetical protein
LENPILAECATVHALINIENLTALAFQTAELSIIECENVRIFHTRSTYGIRNGNESFGIFFTRWMELLLCAKPEDPQLKTLDVIHKYYIHTCIYIRVHTGRSKTQIHYLNTRLDEK